MRAIIVTYCAVEDGFQRMSAGQYIAALACGGGLMLVIGSAIGATGYGLGWW